MLCKLNVTKSKFIIKSIIKTGNNNDPIHYFCLYESVELGYQWNMITTYNMRFHHDSTNIILGFGNVKKKIFLIDFFFKQNKL